MTTRKKITLVFTLITIVFLFTGCTASWITEATSVIQLLVPAISSIMAILSAFGVGITPSVMASVQSWAAQATTGLQTVATLIAQYDTAEATAKPGLLAEIQNVLSTITNNLASILPEIHVDDAATQAKIVAIIQLVESEMQALINLVPAISGKVTSHKELKALMSALQSPDEFKESFNSQAGQFGAEYRI